jgi:hypothetical protein
MSRQGWRVLALGFALLLAGCDRSSEDTSDTGAGSSTRASIPPPADLVGRVRIVKVRLSWKAPMSGAALQGYGVYRNGELLEGMSASELTFTDDDVRPGKDYTYEVRARGSGAVSEPASVRVEVPVPPLKMARLVGDFAVTSGVIRKLGYGEFKVPTFGWHFTPRCDEGPCDVSWRDMGDDRIQANLHRQGRRYSGHYVGFFTSRCFGTRATSSVDISLEVSKARAIAGDWRATKLVGSLENSQAPQLGCGAASFELAVTARIRTA